MPAKPNEIMITRVYDAPVKLVWEVWTDLKHVEKWWGPRGFTITTKSKDFRPGGKWIYTMHGPDGADYPNITTYHEIIKYEKMVYDHGANETQDKLFTVTATFKEQKGKTTLTMIMALATPEQAQAIKQHIKNANGNSTWDRLGEYLHKESSGEETFIINRSFKADPKTLFDLWTNPEHFVRWMGPAGSQMTFLSHNFKEGGSSIWSMTMNDGQTKYGKLEHQKLSPPNTIIYTQNFCDKDGKLTKLYVPDPYPDLLRTTVLFTPEEGNETRVTLKWEILGGATDVERQTFTGMRSNMTVGWNESFDKLDAILGK